MKGIKLKYEPGSVGAFSGISFEDYRNLPGENFSRLKLMDVCPKLYRAHADGLVKQATDPMRLGRIVHAAALEKERGHYHVRPATYPDAKTGKEKPWSGNANYCKEWDLAHADMPILSTHEHEMVRNICTTLWSHPVAWPLMKGARREVSLFAEYAGIMCKGRADLVQENYLIDFKVVADASDRAMHRAIFQSYSWYAQLAFYWKLANLVGLNSERCYIIAVEKGPVPLVNVIRLADSVIDIGIDHVDRMIDNLIRCESTGVWPDYAGTSFKDITELSAPAWMQMENEVELLIDGQTVAA